MVKYVVVALAVLIGACTGSSTADVAKVSQEDSIRIVQRYIYMEKQRIALDQLESDTSIGNLCKKLAFPDIRFLDHEAYLLYRERPSFLKPDYVYFAERRDDKYSLISKAYFYKGSIIDSLVSIWGGKRIVITKDTVLQTVNQQITKEQWSRFVDLLDESYYWAFENPCSKGDGYLDGEVWMLASKAYHCGSAELNYHVTYVHVPKGSYKAACEYLMSLSTPPKPKI